MRKTLAAREGHRQIEMDTYREIYKDYILQSEEISTQSPAKDEEEEEEKQDLVDTSS